MPGVAVGVASTPHGAMLVGQFFKLHQMRTTPLAVLLVTGGPVCWERNLCLYSVCVSVDDVDFSSSLLHFILKVDFVRTAHFWKNVCTCKIKENLTGNQTLQDNRDYESCQLWVIAFV